jgi:hypothetical protein
MIKYTRFFIIFLLAVTAFKAQSQSTATSSSPYSRYGLGDFSPSILPQNIAMGGIATAINKINNYNSINPLNPASYATISATTIDIGLYGNSINLSQTGQPSQSNTNFRLSHIAFAFPVTRHSALSFGLLPYSTLGYNFKQTVKGFGTGSPVDTNAVNYLYSGEGSLSKAYIGYGFAIGRHLFIGANVSYIFGNLKNYQSTEIPALEGTLNSRVEQSNSVGGLNYDYGAQYQIDLSLTRHIVLGYSASANSRIGTQNTYIVSQYSFDDSGNANIPADSLINNQSTKAKIQLPQINHFGISYQKDEKFLVGADFTTGKWSNLSIAGVNQGLRDSKTLNLGGQFTPNLRAIGNYWDAVDYRLGLILDQTYLTVPNPTGGGTTNINTYAVTFGLGLPLHPNNLSFYKVNLSAEVGKRGTLNNGLVKENYINVHLGFTLNDAGWFQRYKFD